MRVCQFRHDGKWTCIAAAARKPPIRKTYTSILQTRSHVSNHREPGSLREPPCLQWLKVLPYSSFAFIVIFAFNTFDTGHPFSAASAYF